MRTFARYYDRIGTFISRILSEQPDFVVPVAKKGAKLLRLTQGIPPSIIRYRAHFRLFEPDLRGVRVAIVDDATQHTSSLREHRDFFEKRGATVHTYSFVGHDQLATGRRLQYDAGAHIEFFLPDPVYQEYIIQQAYYLLEHGNHFDIDHLVFDFSLPAELLPAFMYHLPRLGMPLLEDDERLGDGVSRFAIDDLRAFRCLPYFSHQSVSMGALRKLKFVHTATDDKLAVSPMVFPTWRYTTSEFRRSAFARSPFPMPLPMPPLSRREDRKGVLCTYFNISALYQASILKAFLQATSSLEPKLTHPQGRRTDLAALLGDEVADRYIADVVRFLESEDTHSYASAKPVSPTRRRVGPPLTSFGDVVDELKSGYQRALKKRKRRVGVHYFVGYESLFARYADRHSLSEFLDRYCDLGVVVPETIDRNGTMLRACRSGEPDAERAWLRTQVLIPLAITQFLTETSADATTVGPTVLNKLLSNFQFDYPRTIHSVLHCMEGTPYKYGTLVHVNDPLRAPDRPSLYESRKISRYYRYDENAKAFRVVDHPGMVRRIGALFDDRDEVPYSEIVSYFRFLTQVYALRRRVDVLNALSLCRDEPYCFAHIRHNLTAATTHLTAYLEIGRPDLDSELDAGSRQNKQVRRARAAMIADLEEGAENAASATDKVQLAMGFDDLLEDIRKHLGRKPEFVKVLSALENSYSKHSDGFRAQLPELGSIAALARVIAVFALAVETRQAKYARILVDLDADKVLSAKGLRAPIITTEDISLSEGYRTEILAMVSRLSAEVRLLPLAEPFLESRTNRVERERARNSATAYVYEHQMDELCLLYADFTGLRRIPEPKDAVISSYYRYSREAAVRRGGTHLYGGKGGDDALVWFFPTSLHAIECARDIKRAFAEDMFLSTYDVKFGLSVVACDGDEKEERVIQCWGEAKDCCEFKSPTWRNKGYFLLSERTLHQVGGAGGLRCGVIPVADQFVGGEAHLQLYRLDGIEPL